MQMLRAVILKNPIIEFLEENEKYKKLSKKSGIAIQKKYK